MSAAITHGESEFRPRRPGPLYVWVRRASFIELAIFAGLLVVWAIPGLKGATFVFGLAHGIGYLALCLLLWIAILKREAPFWLFAATLTPVGPVGSVIGIEWIDRRARESVEAPPEVAEEEVSPAGSETPPAGSSASRPVPPGGGQTATGDQEPAEPSEIGDVLALVRASLEQGNIVVSVDGEVEDLRGTGLHGAGFDPIELPAPETESD